VEELRGREVQHRSESLRGEGKLRDRPEQRQTGLMATSLCVYLTHISSVFPMQGLCRIWLPNYCYDWTLLK